MHRFPRAVSILGLMGLIVAPLLATPVEVELKIIKFIERHKAEFDMVPSKRVPGSRIQVKVKFEEGQNRIEMSYARMQPAVLFGGEITCYVLWAINREGTSENLGEFWVRPEKNSDKIEYSTGLRNFALMVTAEPYYLVRQPSQLVITYNGSSRDPRTESTPLIFSDFGPLPKHDLDTLARARYDTKAPLDMVQAERVYEIAARLGAAKYAQEIYREADIRLQQARQMAKTSRARRGTQEFARKSVAASNDAIQIALRRKEAVELEEEIDRRMAEMALVEKRAAAAEADARRTREEAEKAEAAVRASQAELDRIQRDKAVIETEKATLESALANLRQEAQRLQSEKAALSREKSLLEGRLQNALSRVAETRESARGYILNLPDILFGIDKATLKPEARELIAKLSGILLIMQDHKLQAEGHTDSTGSAEYNLALSQSRARSVVDFMAQQGIQHERMRAVGYGFERPIAENSTAEGRRRNRRVEIILSQEQIAALPVLY
ncbi:OmpA family protein [Acidobacteria bacterium AH-259-O06]|nr:OmpA family protein [Acidobacteria bacterium AH-259-O06]